MAFTGFAQRLGRNERGGAAMLTAVSAPLLMGAAGLAMDTVQWTVWKRQLQRSADSAAIAGAFARAQAKDVTATATADLAKSLDVVPTSRLIQNAPTVGPYAGNTRAVRVVLGYRKRLPFTSYFLAAAPLLQAEATAAVLSNGEFCVISLENTAATGITMQGSATVDLGCGMASNSVGSAAVSAGGSSSIKATPIAAVGNIPASSNYATGTTFQPFAIPQQDPYAGLPAPVAPSTCKNSALNVQPDNDKKNPKVIKISPDWNKDGNCWRGMDLKGTVEFAPGVYYINGGTFSIGSQATIIGDDVTFILTGDSPSTIATLDINGGAEIKLTAPESGTYKNILFYQDRRALDSGDNKINGNATSKLSGTFYFPSQSVHFSGTSGQETSCVQIVSRRVTFIGNSSIRNVCKPTEGGEAVKGTIVRLVA